MCVFTMNLLTLFSTHLCDDTDGCEICADCHHIKTNITQFVQNFHIS